MIKWGIRIQKSYLIAMGPDCFRVGQPAEILNVLFAKPPKGGWRVCYHLCFEDGVEDLIPISGDYNYLFLFFF